MLEEAGLLLDDDCGTLKLVLEEAGLLLDDDCATLELVLEEADLLLDDDCATLELVLEEAGLLLDDDCGTLELTLEEAGLLLGDDCVTLELVLEEADALLDDCDVLEMNSLLELSSDSVFKLHPVSRQQAKANPNIFFIITLFSMSLFSTSEIQSPCEFIFWFSVFYIHIINWSHFCFRCKFQYAKIKILHNFTLIA